MNQPTASERDELAFYNTPNMLTALRVLMIPVVIWLLYQQSASLNLLAALIFAAASITDYFDGYIARRWNIVTIYGKLMDPLADKFLVVAAIIMLEYLGKINPLIVIVLICRELGITGLRALASAEGVIIPASAAAKWKTGTQMTAIPLIIYEEPILGVPTFQVGTWILYVSIVISIWSAKDYLVEFIRGVKERRRQKRERKLKEATSPSSTR